MKWTDKECLERAQEAEVVLCELARLMQVALTDRKEVEDAMAGMMKRKAGGPAPASS